MGDDACMPTDTSERGRGWQSAKSEWACDGLPVEADPDAGGADRYPRELHADGRPEGPADEEGGAHAAVPALSPARHDGVRPDHRRDRSAHPRPAEPGHDEAHSSQGGKASAAVSLALSEGDAPTQDGEEETPEDRINRVMDNRKQPQVGRRQPQVGRRQPQVGRRRPQVDRRRPPVGPTRPRVAPGRPRVRRALPHVAPRPPLVRVDPLRVGPMQPRTPCRRLRAGSAAPRRCAVAEAQNSTRFFQIARSEHARQPGADLPHLLRRHAPGKLRQE